VVPVMVSLPVVGVVAMSASVLSRPFGPEIGDGGGEPARAGTPQQVADAVRQKRQSRL
jgi:excinuclease UvrABC ATPase subunit